jgi:EmrB/QacA subfamily drug resistance transporter
MNDVKPAETAKSGAYSLDIASVRRIVIGVMLAMLLAAIDQTIVATALPTIGGDLSDLEHLPWVVTAYLLSATAVTPLYGKLADIVGRRTTLLTSILIFVAGSVLCAIAPTMWFLILARFIQGLGGGGLIALAQTIVADIVAPRERMRYQAYFASVFVTSSIAGPVLGGYFAEHLHWSGIFWINLPLGGLAYFMTSDILRRLPRHERPHKLDVAGAVLMVFATVALLVALSWGGGTYAWGSLQILGLFAASGIAWALFFVRLTTAAEPFIPLVVMFDRVVATGTAVNFFVMGTLVALSIYVPIYFEAVAGLTASQSGFALISLMGGTVTGAQIAGRVMAWSKHYKRGPVVGLVVSIAAIVLLAATIAGQPLWMVLVLLAVAGVGFGTIFPVTTVAIQNAVEPHQLGTTTAAFNFFRSLGSAILVAVFGAILLGMLGVSGRSIGSIDTLVAATAANGTPIAPVFGVLFWASALTLGIAFVCLLGMEERPLRGR